MMRTILYFPTNYICTPVELLEDKIREEKMNEKVKELHKVSRKHKSCVVNVSYGILFEDPNNLLEEQKTTIINNEIYS